MTWVSIPAERVSGEMPSDPATWRGHLARNKVIKAVIFYKIQYWMVLQLNMIGDVGASWEVVSDGWKKSIEKPKKIIS